MVRLQISGSHVVGRIAIALVVDNKCQKQFVPITFSSLTSSKMKIQFLIYLAFIFFLQVIVIERAYGGKNLSITLLTIRQRILDLQYTTVCDQITMGRLLDHPFHSVTWCCFYLIYIFYLHLLFNSYCSPPSHTLPGGLTGLHSEASVRPTVCIDEPQGVFGEQFPFYHS